MEEISTVSNRNLLEPLEGLTLVEPAVCASLYDAPNIDERRLSERIGVDLASTQRMVRDQVMASLSERERETLQDLLARVINANELKASRRFS